MKYINSRMFEFLMKERPFGICITDKADKAYGKLKPYGKGAVIPIGYRDRSIP